MSNIEKILSDLYFHELDTKDKIFARLQLNYAIYASGVAILSYMARVVDYSAPCSILIIFYSSLIASLVLLGFSAFLTGKSLTDWKYRILPQLKEISLYEQNLIKTAEQIKIYNEENSENIPISDPKSDLETYVNEELGQCIDYNCNTKDGVQNSSIPTVDRDKGPQ